MALLDLVEYLDPTGNVLAARVPPDGSGELRLGSQCIVREGQLAFFARDGRFLDMLIPGRHTLTTANIPLLVELISLPFGNKSPFRADVYYVSLQQHTDLKWGTPQPIPMRDAQFGMVRLRAFGTYIVQVAEPRKLLTAVVGTRGRFTVQDVEEQLRSSIIARVADVIAEWMRERKLSVIDMATEYDELSEAAHDALKNDFAGLGLELTRFYISTITMPEELEKRRAAAAAAVVTTATVQTSMSHADRRRVRWHLWPPARFRDDVSESSNHADPSAHTDEGKDLRDDLWSAGTMDGL